MNSGMIYPAQIPTPTPRPIIDADIAAVEMAPARGPRGQADAQGAALAARAEAVRLVEQYITRAEQENEARQASADEILMQMADSSPPSWALNAARGVGKVATDLVGNTAGFLGVAGEALGDSLERRFPLGKIEFGPNGIRHVPHTPESIAANSDFHRTAMGVKDVFTDMDFGYVPRTTWQDVKADPWRNTVPFVAEAGVVSLPEMALSVRNPGALAAALTYRMGEARARNNQPQPYAAGK